MYVRYKKLLCVSAPRRHHQLVLNANKYMHQYIDLGSKMASVKIFKC